MQQGQPSRTALGAAAHRAAHQVLEQARIFYDPLAIRILGADAAAKVQEAAQEPSRIRMRIFIAVRSRLAEEALAQVVSHGVRQLVVLGAGLDTYAYRSPFKNRLRIFEVDHPATQAWKREMLTAASIPVPEWLSFAPVDFERETLAEGLASAGFDPSQQTFFTWLGVVPYLTRETIWSTLSFISGISAGSHVIFDYSDPPEKFAPKLREYHEARAARVAELGEAWITHFEPAELHQELSNLGFTEIEDMGPQQIAARFFPNRAASVPEAGGHVLRATRLPSPG